MHVKGAAELRNLAGKRCSRHYFCLFFWIFVFNEKEGSNTTSDGIYIYIYIFVYTNAYDCLFDIFIFLTICFPTSQAKMTVSVLYWSLDFASSGEKLQ